MKDDKLHTALIYKNGILDNVLILLYDGSKDEIEQAFYEDYNKDYYKIVLPDDPVLFDVVQYFQNALNNVEYNISEAFNDIKEIINNTSKIIFKNDVNNSKTNG